MYEKITLPNGVRVVWEKIDYVRSVSVGIWVGNGSRHEPQNLNGISHFLEHMMFKGTENSSAQQLAMQMDALGGQFNAYTTKESTCYYMKVLSSHLKSGMDILSDMFLHSTFNEQDIELERGVINEEIDMYEDSPEDVATEKLFEQCFSDSALGRPILGSKESISSFTTDTLKSYIEEYYLPSETVISISGMFTDGDLNHICSLFSKMQGTGKNTVFPAQYNPKIFVIPKKIEQNHICLGFPGISFTSEQRYAMQILSSIIGGGMSSRLFQSVREQNGLCYSVYSFTSNHQDTGMLSIYTGVSKETEGRALELISNVIREFCENGIKSDELDRCREQLKANILMGLENTSARMHQLGRGELYLGHALCADELIERYDAVTAHDIHLLAQQVFNFSGISLCAVGQTETAEYYKNFLE